MHPCWKRLPSGRDRERREQRADAARGHQHAITLFAEMQDIVRERRHEHRVGPAENSDDSEERKNRQRPRMIPNVTKSFQRLTDGAVFARRGACFGNRIINRPADDGDEADAIEKETHRDADFCHEHTGD